MKVVFVFKLSRIKKEKDFLSKLCKQGLCFTLLVMNSRGSGLKYPEKLSGDEYANSKWFCVLIETVIGFWRRRVLTSLSWPLSVAIMNALDGSGLSALHGTCNSGFPGSQVACPWLTSVTEMHLSLNCHLQWQKCIRLCMAPCRHLQSLKAWGGACQANTARHSVRRGYYLL